ncbi:MarR family winged helix-turn-helix transcriptional regulator [Gehongia tenuis]|uniref:MarR family transcriptional regulator n=1 Tax=Gehongia tenuis TaxID=2763655 RepID=A0A926D6B6_9FIRM|nr:MarR family transcriptional regulator [Gehongia tenuis]
MDPEMNGVVRQLMEAFHAFQKLHVEKHGPKIGASRSEITLLLMLHAHGGEKGLKVSQLSRRLDVAPPTVTQMINSLERKGFLERSIDPEDRRAVLVKLTERGSEIMERGRRELMQRFHGLIQYMGPEDAKELARLLNKTAEYMRHRQIKKGEIGDDQV